MAAPLRSLFFLLLLTALGGGAASLPIQAQEVEPTPYTALIDFTLHRHPAARALPSPGLPIWLERVDVFPAEAREAGEAVEARTTFRLRLRPLPGIQQALLLRLFFDDRPDARPVVSAWSETGERKMPSVRLGAGLNLPASESVAIPTDGVDLVEIEVPGDGSGIRQALVATLRIDPVATAFDFARARPVADPFGAAPTPEARGELADTFLFGRVRALLDPGPVPLHPLPPPASAAAPPAGEEETNLVTFAFRLEAEPLLALLQFDLLNPDPAAPLLMWVNDEPVGVAAYQMPDLADPGYQGVVRSLRKMRFHYAGWVRAQKIVPAGVLRAGENTVTLQLPAEAAPVALRNVELQLKNHWQKLDYILVP